MNSQYDYNIDGGGSLSVTGVNTNSNNRAANSELNSYQSEKRFSEYAQTAYNTNAPQ